MVGRNDPYLVETHISTLFFAGERVYKLAKRVDLPFLRTLEADERLRLATREFELNRRFAPDVYLGLADVHEGGDVVDRMIAMRRLPRDRRLSRLLAAGEGSACLRDVARAVASMHARTASVERAQVNVDRLEQNWRDNFDALERHVGSTIDRPDFDRVAALARTSLRHNRALRLDRADRGLVLDGHGDLTADDIYCLDDGPRILDCLAFDDDLRVDDVLNDIAFLVMDVHRLAGPEPARQLMAAYHEFSNEQHPPSLAHHYVAYRAHVRAKVAGVRVDQGDEDSVALVRVYHDLAAHHLERAQVQIIVVGGGQGTGKTTLARRLADHFGYVHLATDEIRHDVARIPHGQHAFAALDEDAYDPDVVDVTYAEQCREARTLASNGYGVVLDASWTSNVHRSDLRRIAGDLGIDPIEIECVVDEATARTRVEQRLAAADDPSDAPPDLVSVLARRRQPWPEAHVIDTTVDPDAVEADALAHIESCR